MLTPIGPVCTLLLAAWALAACAPESPPPASPVAERWPGISLPAATNALPMDDSPVVVVDGAHVLVDGEVAGDVSAVVAAHRLQRIDPLFERLKALRAASIAAHPSEPFRGQLNLVIDANVPAVAVKSVFQTAAFAGYPFASFVVRRSPPASGVETYGLLPVDAQVPGPPPATSDTRHASTSITPPSMRGGATAVNGRLPAEIIQRLVRQNFGGFRRCYEQGLTRNPQLQGEVLTRFVIGEDGHVVRAETAQPRDKPRLPDPAVDACVVAHFETIAFPAPEGGIVTVVYPIIFNPGD